MNHSPGEAGVKVECAKCTTLFVLGEGLLKEWEYGPGLAKLTFFGTFFVTALWVGWYLAVSQPNFACVLLVMASVLSWVCLVLSAVAFVGSARWYASTKRAEGIVGLGASGFAFLASAGYCLANLYFLATAMLVAQAAARPILGPLP